MRALTITPGVPDSARLDDVPDPPRDAGTLLVRALALGVCGTDAAIVAGRYGTAPPGHERLILGHESLGRVEESPLDSGFAPGDLVVGIVRHPDPVPCENCAVGEWDMCRNGRYTEHGIKGLDGFGVEQYRLAPEFAVPVDSTLGMCGVLLEPASVVAKAWEHIERIGRRAHWVPRHVLVTGAGPVGLLAALLGVQRGLAVTVFDRVTEGAKPDVVRALGATYLTGSLDAVQPAPDIVIECTGAASVVVDVLGRTSRGGILCLTGLSERSVRLPVDIGRLDRTLVLENDVAFGSVNANRRHYEAAAAALLKADREWLARLMTRQLPLDRWRDALAPSPQDIKTVIDFTI